MIWLGEIVAGETVPLRAQFHDDTANAADPTTPAARMETGVGAFADLAAPTKRDARTGYYGVDVDTTGFAAGIRTVRIGGTVATAKVTAAVYGFRVVAHRAEAAAKPADLPSLATLEGRFTALRAGYLDNLATPPAQPGAAMALTPAERTAVANEVETQIIDETDSEKVLAAIVAKIAAANPSLEGLTLGAIAIQVRAELAVELARIDAAITTRMAGIAYVAPDNQAVAAVKAQTDRMVFTTPGKVDASAVVDTSTIADKGDVADIIASIPRGPALVAYTYELGEDRDSDGLPDRDELGALLYPIAQAYVYATATDSPDLAGMLDGGHTNALGSVTLHLPVNPETYFWRHKTGRINFANPDIEDVS